MIETAIRSDGSQPAQEFLEDLRNKRWLPDPDADSFPSDAQLDDYFKFVDLLRHFAENGTPKYKGQVEYLHKGVWEFKIGKKRLSWFDTAGDGTYSEKRKFKDRKHSDYPDDDDFWHIPEFDERIRLGHAFPKKGQKSGEFNVNEAIQVREEDLRYDQHEVD